MEPVFGMGKMHASSHAELASGVLGECEITRKAPWLYEFQAIMARAVIEKLKVTSAYPLPLFETCVMFAIVSTDTREVSLSVYESFKVKQYSSSYV
jgi:hypothetical protein